MSEKDRMKNTGAWPLWPRLPVKRRKSVGMPEIGFITADEVEADGSITIHSGNVFIRGEKRKTRVYPSLDAMLQAGWVGD